MASHIQIKEVAERKVIRYGFPSRTGAHQRQHPPAVITSLGDISAQATGLLVPTVMPEGYAFNHGRVLDPAISRLVYYKDLFVLQVTQGLPQYQSNVQRGFVEQKLVAGYEGYLIRGCWTYFVHRGESRPTQSVWTGFSISLVLERDAKVVVLKAWQNQPENGSVSETALLEVASSLSAY